MMVMMSCLFHPLWVGFLLLGRVSGQDHLVNDYLRSQKCGTIVSEPGLNIGSGGTGWNSDEVPQLLVAAFGKQHKSRVWHCLRETCLVMGESYLKRNMANLKGLLKLFEGGSLGQRVFLVRTSEDELTTDSLNQEHTLIHHRSDKGITQLGRYLLKEIGHLFGMF